MLLTVWDLRTRARGRLRLSGQCIASAMGLSTSSALVRDAGVLADFVASRIRVAVSRGHTTGTTTTGAKVVVTSDVLAIAEGDAATKLQAVARGKRDRERVTTLRKQRKPFKPRHVYVQAKPSDLAFAMACKVDGLYLALKVVPLKGVQRKSFVVEAFAPRLQQTAKLTVSRAVIVASLPDDHALKDSGQSVDLSPDVHKSFLTTRLHPVVLASNSKLALRVDMPGSMALTRAMTAQSLAATTSPVDPTPAKIAGHTLDSQRNVAGRPAGVLYATTAKLDGEFVHVKVAAAGADEGKLGTPYVVEVFAIKSSSSAQAGVRRADVVSGAGAAGRDASASEELSTEAFAAFVASSVHPEWSGSRFSVRIGAAGRAGGASRRSVADRPAGVLYATSAKLDGEFVHVKVAAAAGVKTAHAEYVVEVSAVRSTEGAVVTVKHADVVRALAQVSRASDHVEPPSPLPTAVWASFVSACVHPNVTATGLQVRIGQTKE